MNFFFLYISKMLNVEAIGIETNNWVFGCSAIEIYKKMRYW